MLWTVVLEIILALALALGGWVLFVWAVRSGQYDDPEGPKYRMLEDGHLTEERNKPGKNEVR